MKSKLLFSTLAICSTIGATAIALNTAIASQDAITASNKSNSPVTAAQIRAKATEAGYSNVDRVKFEEDAIEVTALNDAGQRVEIYFDTARGDVVRTKFESDRRTESHDERHNSSDLRG